MRGANRRVDQDYFWPRWHYPYTGQVAEDRSCQWRTLPAPFDMAWRCYEQYLWTGDDKWINDPEMFQYHTNLHTKFMEHQKWDGNDVADELTQLASYFEFPDARERLIEAGDAIGCQYQALLAYANILKHRGDSAAAQTYLDKARRLRAYFETHWFDEQAGRYIRGFDRFTDFKSDWGRENSYFLPLTLITDQGPRTAAYLDFIDASITREPLNIEATTYLAEVFYKHGRNETAWKYLQQQMKSRHNYPEVSFTCVGNIIAGLMGVRPDAPSQTAATLPGLTADVAWVEADHIPVGRNDLYVRHDGNHQTTLRNNQGPAMTWLAQFPGNYRQLQVNGTAQQATVTTLNGRTISYVALSVAAGKPLVVQTLGAAGPDLPAPPSPQLPDEAPPPKPAPGTYYLSDMKWRYAASRSSSPIKLDATQEGKPITISGVPYSKGIGVQGLTAIRYDLHQQYSRLLADVGFTDPAQDQGSVEFVVYGGTKISSLLYASGVMRVDAGAGIRHINIDVGGCDYIVLGVKDADDGDQGDRVGWANVAGHCQGRHLRHSAADRSPKSSRRKHRPPERAIGVDGFDGQRRRGGIRHLRRLTPCGQHPIARLSSSGPESEHRLQIHRKSLGCRRKYLRGERGDCRVHHAAARSRVSEPIAVDFGHDQLRQRRQRSQCRRKTNQASGNRLRPWGRNPRLE